MKCPRCERALQTVDVGGVKVDACQGGCGGIWFDAHELERMDQPDEPAGWLLENMRVDLELTIDTEAALNCPRCEGAVPLMRQRYEQDSATVIDKCRACGGVWLDFGELFSIRSGNPTSEEHRTRTLALLKGLRQG